MKYLAIIVGFVIGSAFVAFMTASNATEPDYIEFDTPGGMHCVRMRGFSYGMQPALSCIDNREYQK